MFRKLLRLARDRSTIDMGGLARDLGVSSDEVRRMVKVLEQLGYVERTVLGCTPTMRTLLAPANLRVESCSAVVARNKQRRKVFISD